MRISKTPNATPHSTPPSSGGNREGLDSQAWDEQFIWTSLVPRLVHPTKLAIIKALIEAGNPLSVNDLIPLLPSVEGNEELVRYHANAMTKVGVLELLDIRAEEPRFSFRRTD
jgi:hypothetical protein